MNKIIEKLNEQRAKDEFEYSVKQLIEFRQTSEILHSVASRYGSDAWDLWEKLVTKYGRKKVEQELHIISRIVDD